MLCLKNIVKTYNKGKSNAYEALHGISMNINDGEMTAIIGTSGAGKTFTMQLMALRMRRKNIQVFILAPLKGHEFHRACQNIGGEFIQISPASSNCIVRSKL